MASNDNSPRVDMAKLEAEVTLPRVSAVTAETVTRDFESALKEIEAMGAELISVAKKCEAMTTDVQSTIRETAAAYRQEGKKIFELIEERALSTEDIRKTCGDAIRRRSEGSGGVQ